MPDVNIQYRFTIPPTDGYPEFTDAVYVSLSDGPLSDAALQALIVARYTNFCAVLDKSALAPEPTVQEKITQLQNQLTELCQSYVSITAQRDMVLASIALEDINVNAVKTILTDDQLTVFLPEVLSK